MTEKIIPESELHPLERPTFEALLQAVRTANTVVETLTSRENLKAYIAQHFSLLQLADYGKVAATVDGPALVPDAIPSPPKKGKKGGE